MLRQCWDNAELLVCKHLPANKFSKAIIYVACMGTENAHSLRLHPKASPVVSYFSASCCPPAVLLPVVSRKKGKSIQTCHVMREQAQYWMCPHMKHGKMRYVSKKHKKTPSSKDYWTQLWSGSMCERAFVSLFTRMLLCLSLFPVDECDFLLSYQRRPTFRWADGSQWHCPPLPLHKGLCVNTHNYGILISGESLLSVSLYLISYVCSILIWGNSKLQFFIKNILVFSEEPNT